MPAEQTTTSMDSQPGAVPNARELNIEKGSLWLLPEGGVFEPQTKSLLVADVHLGKADSFRRLGVPVPSGPNRVSLERLSAMLLRYRPAQLVFLGDLIHDYLPHPHPVFDDLTSWRMRHQNVVMTLVLGNHDLKSGGLPAACQIRSVQPGARLGPLCLLHEPDANRAERTLHAVAGHIHPVVRINGRRDSVRVRCFWARPGITVLPAFGEFTGGFRITPGPDDAVFIPSEQTVHRLALPVSN